MASNVAPKKNILFITADQWRGDCLSQYGHQVQTPNLDKLAAAGVTFKQHYANAVPCAPSRASIHTGMYLQNHRSGTNGTPLDARHTNWAIELRKQGYDPVLFGYTDTANDPRQFEPNDPILKSFEGPLPGIKPVCMMGETPYQWAEWLDEKGYDIPKPEWRLYTDKQGIEYEQGGTHPAPLKIPKEHHDTWFMIDQVTDYLTQYESDSGFCIHLSLLRPHPPWVAPEPYNSLYPPETLEHYSRAESREQEAAQHPWLAHQLKQKYSAAPVDPKKLARMKASYFGLMTEVDDNLGRLFDYLETHQLLDKTLIVFTSDHGEQIGDHWLIGKSGYFDQSYHVPLIVCDPFSNSSRGSQVDHFTENVDLMPTLLDWCDTEIPVQCDGKSLLGFTREGKAPSHWRDAAHWEFDFRNVLTGEELEETLGLTQHQCSLNVIRDNQYKYVHFTNLAPLFFDIKADPGETTNLADDPKHASLVLCYAQKMLSWRMNHDEQSLTHMTLTEDGVVQRSSPRY